MQDHAGLHRALAYIHKEEQTTTDAALVRSESLVFHLKLLWIPK